MEATFSIRKSSSQALTINWGMQPTLAKNHEIIWFKHINKHWYVRIDWKQFYSQILSDSCLSRSLGLASMRPLLLRIPRQTNFNILIIYIHKKKLLLNQINSGFLAMCRGFKEEEDPPAPEVVVSRHRQVCVNRTSELSGCNPHLTFWSED